MLRAPLLGILLFLNIAFWAAAILLGGIFKLLTRGESRRRVILALSAMAEQWVRVNNRLFDLFLTTRWEVSPIPPVAKDGRYLIISNHVSWIDILAVLHAFEGRTAFIRFFLKYELLWVPLVGQACKALEFPFMRRYSPEYLARHPEKRGRDLETTIIACQRYRDIPVAILNYAEGTRFTARKREAQGSPYRHLLRPRVGGIGFVLASLGAELDAVFDVTIVYPRTDVTFVDFLLNRIDWIHVETRKLDVPRQFLTPAVTEPGPAREEFKKWMETLWREKDERIDARLGGVLRS